MMRQMAISVQDLCAYVLPVPAACAGEFSQCHLLLEDVSASPAFGGVSVTKYCDWLNGTG